MSSSSSPSSAQAAGAAGGSAGAQAAQGGTDWKWQIGKAVLFYMGTQAVVGPNGLIAWYRGTSQAQQQSNLQSSPASHTDLPSSQSNLQGSAEGLAGATSQQQPFIGRVPPQMTTHALFENLLPLDVYVFVSSNEAATHEDVATQYSSLVPHGKGSWATSLSAVDNNDYAELLQDPMREAVTGAKVVRGPQGLPAIKWSNITLNDASLQRTAELMIKLPEDVKTSNASLWADIVVVPMGKPLGDRKSLRMRKMLTRLFPERKEREERNLFSKTSSNENSSSSKSSASPSLVLPFLDKEPVPLITHWHNNLTLAIVAQDPGSGYPIGKLPPPVLQWVHVLESSDDEIVTVDNPNIALNYPVVFPNDFWHLREHMYPINSTLDSVPLYINLYTTTFFKFQLLAALGDSFEKQPSMASGELDILKRTLLETNPWYLGITVAVSILHSIFEFLAFSSDVSHWRNKENMTGVSLGTILTNVIVQLIILLYLIDQSQETSYMILASQGIGIVIEAWKLTKAVTVSIVPRTAGTGLKALSWLPYRVKIEDKHKLSEEELKTQEYDKLAFKIVACVAAPLLGGYTIYSAVYQSHKGWWSFIIGTLCSFVYAFGFVSLIPQLIVNYKLKSTAGMNPKTFVYKILGTFVDDLFAFAIKMPILHRLACFRDDVVFLVFLYQRWIYGVDNTRANEFGQVVERKDKSQTEEKEKKDQ